MQPPLLLVTRPRPEADRTAEMVRNAGFRALIAPLLVIRVLAPAPLADRPDALLLTSARSARLAAAAFPALLAGTPTYAVGPATAAAAAEAGFRLAAAGQSDGQAALALAAGHRTVLHVRGADGVPLVPPPDMHLVERILYKAEAVGQLQPAVAEALRLEPEVAVLLFSPRTARIFSDRVDAAGLPRDHIAIGALSGAVAAAAGCGWRAVRVADAPTAAQCVAAAAGLWQDTPAGGRHARDEIARDEIARDEIARDEIARDQDARSEDARDQEFGATA
jgi:uroporphyrinogen-III synthase